MKIIETYKYIKRKCSKGLKINIPEGYRGEKGSQYVRELEGASQPPMLAAETETG
jgi:hypothetical protein